MLKGTKRFDVAFQGKRYAIGSTDDVKIQIEGAKDDEPKELVILAETQEVLEHLKKQGNRFVEEVKAEEVAEGKKPKGAAANTGESNP